MEYPNDIVFFDFEVFAHDWLVVFKPFGEGKAEYFWNDNDGVKAYLDSRDVILCGYNSNNYDSYILKAVMLDYSPEMVKRVNDEIIGGKYGWMLFGYDQKVLMPPRIDLFQDVVPRKGLKEIQGNLCQPIVESSIPFDHPTPLTPEEQYEVGAYCENDVRSTELLFNIRRSYVDNKFVLSENAGLDPFQTCHKTNAALVAEVLGATKQEYPFEWYTVPDNLDQSHIPAEVLDYASRVNTDNGVDRVVAKQELGDLEVEIGGCPTVVGVGGIHAALPNYVEKTDDVRVILLQDIASYYPSLMLQNGYLSRSVASPELFRKYYDMRIKAKHEGDKATADAAKLVLNTTYGASRSETNNLFDPIMGLSICISGQLYIIDLIQMMVDTVPSLKVIQLNTDGWMISLDRDEMYLVDAAVDEWEARTGFNAETDYIDCVFQRDVNNYLVKFADGSTKTKGKLFSGYPEGDFRSNEFTVVSRAMVEYLLNGVPVEETIHNEQNIFAFQMIAKKSSKYDGLVHIVDGKEVPQQNTVRVFAGKDPRYGGIFKVKGGHRKTGAYQGEDGLWYKGEAKVKDKVAKTTTLVPKLVGDGKNTLEKVASSPKCVIIDNVGEIDRSDIDDQFYIDLAVKKLAEWYTDGEEGNMAEATPKPKAKPKVEKEETIDNAKAVTSVPHTRETDAAKFAKKWGGIAPFLIENFEFMLDKVTQNGGAYASTQQYKVALALACRSVGLVHWFSTKEAYSTDFDFQTNKGPKRMSCGHFVGTYTFCDPDTGYTVEMDIAGVGQDGNVDHAFLKSSTYAFRAWFLTTFMVHNKHEQALEFTEDGAAPSDKPSYGFVSGTEQAAKASAVNTAAKMASPGLLKQMVDTLLLVRVKDATFGQKVFDLLVEGDPTTGEVKVKDGVELPYSDAVATLSTIEGRADELGIEV